MGFLSSIFSGAAAAPIEAIGGIFDKLFTSDDERLTHEEVKLRLAQQPHLAQIALNKAEAGHRSIFVAGWRPGLGWVGVIGLAIYFIPQYSMGAYIWLIICLDVINSGTITGDNILTALPPYPVDGSSLMELVIAMLGLGGLRTAEKLAGRAK